MLAQWKDMRGPPGSESVGAFKVGKPYKIDGRRYYPEESYTLNETGIASWYGPGFHGKYTANGEEYDQYELTAAHRTLQLPSLVRVTNLENGRSVVVRVNDRGPFSKGRIIDVSKRAADLLGFKGQGTARVRVQVLPEESRQLAALAKQGRSTKGMEVAFNETGRLPVPRRVTSAPTLAVYQEQLDPPQPVATPRHTVSERAAINQQQAGGMVRHGVYSPSGVPGHVQQGRFYPDPVVKQFPVAATSLFIQAGSYSDPNNARDAAQRLSSLGPVRVAPATVGGRVYYRVQVGPIDSVDRADALLSRVINTGYPEARIWVSDRNTS
jgi:rare lipoprotein A